MGLRGMTAEHQLANAEVTAKMADGFSHIPARYWRHRAIRARVFRPARTFAKAEILPTAVGRSFKSDLRLRLEGWA